MKPQFQHQVITSFALWLDHVILNRGQAFQNIESSFYYQNDERLDPDFVSFASPHKQWVTDSGVNKAKIIDSIILDGYKVDRGKQGIKYDFNNGRVLVPRMLANSGSNVEGSYAVKDFNVYITDQTEEELLIETKFDKNSRFDQDIFQGIKPYDQVVPAIFCSYEQGENVPFAFGGEDTTQSSIRCVVFAENSYQLDGVFSILKDLNLSSIANVGFYEHPLNEFGDLKYGSYDYKDLSDRYFNVRNSGSTFYLDGVSVSKLNDRVAKKAHPGLYIGFVDFAVRAHRFPRQPLVEPVASRPPAVSSLPMAPYALSIEVTQLPFSPEGLQLDKRTPYPPEGLELEQAGLTHPYAMFLTSIEHHRLQQGDLANISLDEGGKIIIRLDGSANQIAFLNIMGADIQIGSSSDDKLIWDGYTFNEIGEVIARNIGGIDFEITWVGTGSQVLELKRVGGESYLEFECSVYVPCE